MFVTVLHNIRSVHNVGSIFRTADGAGCARIYLCGITPTPLDRFRKVRKDFAKVSLGAEGSVPWEKNVSTARTITALKKEGYTILALEQAEGSVHYMSVIPALPARPGSGNPERKIALVVGNEVNGLPPSILKLADKIIEIPMRGAKESLNVGVAFGIAAYHLVIAGKSHACDMLN